MAVNPRCRFAEVCGAALTVFGLEELRRSGEVEESFRLALKPTLAIMPRISSWMRATSRPEMWISSALMSVRGDRFRRHGVNSISASRSFQCAVICFATAGLRFQLKRWPIHRPAPRS